MVRIAGINLSNDKRITHGLTDIFGIGLTTAQRVVKECKISGDPKIKELTDPQIELLRTYIDKNIRVEGDARVLITRNIKRLRDIGAYRGLRHASHLPVRGQRTKTNARTRKGPKVTMGSGRKKAAAKT